MKPIFYSYCYNSVINCK
ncbi:hypothetical protein EXE30_15265 [Acinetobacter halotolerans]|uniref:Uncharacterized protein n=1 Tax=Acinetobacter halotolerans TaxID=1752076 RepID=A0A4Q6XCK9_9GAMM|nr:hypothetical protein EXE30_15265 [Acinetobacter halotolerans]